MIGLNVPVSAECEPDKSNRQQDGAGYDQPMRISHLSTSLRSFSLLSISAPHSARCLQHEARVVIMIAAS